MVPIFWAKLYTRAAKLLRKDLLTCLIESFGCGLQVYWVGPYIGSTISSIVYQFSEFINDHFKRRRREEDENAQFGIPYTVLLFLQYIMSEL